MAAATAGVSGPVAPPPFAEAARVFAGIGLLSFGGPAAQIALMHRVLVGERQWLDEATYLRALNFCMLLPGPEAMQLATFAGWRLHGLKGGLTAGLLFMLPGAVVVLALAMLYSNYGTLPLVAAVFLGVKAAVLVIVVEALLRVARKALKESAHWVIAGLAFAALFCFDAPFPLVVIAAAIAGAICLRQTASAATAPLPPVPWRGTIFTIAAWLAIWWAPVALAAAVLGGDHVLVSIGVFFSKLAVVTFGGAYAVLTYMAQQAVESYRWLTPGEMLDGLGLAETTPGPLILVTEFVAYLGASRAGGSWSIGILGAAMALWTTFAPCFLWILAGAPYIERLPAMPRLSAALSGITAAVVGVILNLSAWFAVHVLFGTVRIARPWPLRLIVPDPATLDLVTAAIAAVSAVALLRFHLGIPRTLLLAAALGLATRASL